MHGNRASTKLRRWLLPLALLAGAACAKPPPAVLFGPARPLTAADYGTVLRTWTRSDKVYEGLNNIMFIDVTFHAPEFRRAFAVAFPDVYGHGGQVTRRELVDLTGDVEQHHTFFVKVHTPDVDWNDLEEPDSIWRVNLVSSNEVAVPPSEIIKVKIDENLRVVYPYLGRFDQAYLVRFPLVDHEGKQVITEQTERFAMRVASAMGVATLTWDLVVPSRAP